MQPITASSCTIGGCPPPLRSWNSTLAPSHAGAYGGMSVSWSVGSDRLSDLPHPPAGRTGPTGFIAAIKDGEVGRGA
ncbi:hypothetical protein HEK616_67680 [Streptomyces nigrescens]|uniref:Uncharacterized protein n=1 Tax=Streptomyces nigrescens TaxID=1920 RepID=A0ABM8A3N6_STRNI|nr:hypothetical protein HEK616_67680 [Streptomyces nigrescens]